EPGEPRRRAGRPGDPGGAGGPRPPAWPDAGVRAHAPPARERPPEQAVEHRPGRALGAGELPGPPDLPLDLALPEHHRVEARGDPEEGPRSPPPVMEIHPAPQARPPPPPPRPHPA